MEPAERRDWVAYFCAGIFSTGLLIAVGAMTGQWLAATGVGMISLGVTLGFGKPIQPSDH